MAEVQSAPLSGEMTQRFFEFVMMEAQQAALFLGRIPNPQSGKTEVRLDMARLFIDRLELIQDKTRGNLSNEESEMLRSVLADLQLAYVQVSQGSVETSEVAAETPSTTPETPVDEPAEESRKKFTKSYGA